MKTNFTKTAAILGIAVMAAVGCKKTSDATSGNVESASKKRAAAVKPCASIPVDANGIITKAFLPNDTTWRLDGVSYVKPGTTLTIQQGTVVVTGTTKTYNDPAFGPQTIAGVLVVPKTAKLQAVGTPTEPIVFTTPQVGGCSGAGCNVAGNFGGVVLLGQAPTNQPTSTRIEGVPQPAGTDITYGGSISADNSGNLSYVRIEFPGYRLAEANEINGLTLGGVGSGTVLSHIQVSYSADDSFEFFGGTVNADHLVALAGDDDDFDFDFGYTGTIDYALGLKSPNSTHSTSGGVADANGIESDNMGTTTSTVTPFTKPVLRHFTLLGYATNSNLTDLEKGTHFRRSSSLDFQFSVVGGYPIGAHYENITNPASYSNNVLQAYTSSQVNSPTAPSVNTPNNILTAPSSAAANTFLQLGPALGSAPFYSCANAATYNVSHLIPRSGSPAFGTATTFKGAFQPSVAVWTANWTNFNPNFCCN